MYTLVKSIIKLPFGEIPIEFIVENSLEATRNIIKGFCYQLDDKDTTYESIDEIPHNYDGYFFEKKGSKK